MKTNNINTILLSAVFILGSVISPIRATENLEVNAIDEAKKIRMELSIPASGAINVMLYDDFERIVYSDRIAAGATFEDEFDFSTVRKGKYRLVSELGNLRYNRIFHVDKNAVEFKESYYSFAPQFRQEGGQLMVHYINNLQESLGISIEDEYGRIFDAYYDTPAETFARAYDLEQLGTGSYIIHLLSGGEMFSYSFTID